MKPAMKAVPDRDAQASGRRALVVAGIVAVGLSTRAFARAGTAQ